MRPENSVKKDGYLTLDNVPEARTCRAFSIPDSAEWLGTFMGAIAPLLTEEAWRSYGELTPEECAAEWQRIFFSFETDCPQENTVDAPYWDTDDDVDDEEPIAEQEWYGYVIDAVTPPDTGDFIADATIFAFEGLIVASLGLAGIAPALAFKTIASKFVVEFKNGGDAGTVLRFFLDGVKVAQKTTTGDGSVEELTLVGDPDLDEHQLYIVAEVA